MNGDEVIDWESADYGWDGEFFSLTVSHAVEEPTSEWLDRYLADRLAGLSGLQDVRVTVTGAPWDEAGVPPVGTMLFSGLRAPLPDANEFRQHVLAAVREANESTDAARAEIQRFDRQLRGVPQ